MLLVATELCVIRPLDRVSHHGSVGAERSLQRKVLEGRACVKARRMRDRLHHHRAKASTPSAPNNLHSTASAQQRSMAQPGEGWRRGKNAKSCKRLFGVKLPQKCGLPSCPRNPTKSNSTRAQTFSAANNDCVLSGLAPRAVPPPRVTNLFACANKGSDDKPRGRDGDPHRRPGARGGEPARCVNVCECARKCVNVSVNA